MLKLPVDWGSLWLGGFCPVEALGGLPVRGADYAAHPPLDERLTLPANAALHAGVTLEEAEATWSERLGGAWVVLVRDAYRARRLLHQAAGIQPGEWVGVPANASHDLAESVKHHKALPRFLDFDAHLRSRRPVRASPGRRWCAGCGSRRTLRGSTALTPCLHPARQSARR